MDKIILVFVMAQDEYCFCYWLDNRQLVKIHQDAFKKYNWEKLF